MSKIFVKFSGSYDFVLFDPEQGILRRKGKGEQPSIEVRRTSFVEARIKEGLLVEAPKKSKDK